MTLLKIMGKYLGCLLSLEVRSDLCSSVVYCANKLHLFALLDITFFIITTRRLNRFCKNYPLYPICHFIEKNGERLLGLRWIGGAARKVSRLNCRRFLAVGISKTYTFCTSPKCKQILFSQLKRASSQPGNSAENWIYYWFGGKCAWSVHCMKARFQRSPVPKTSRHT